MTPENGVKRLSCGVAVAFLVVFGGAGSGCPQDAIDPVGDQNANANANSNGNGNANGNTNGNTNGVPPTGRCLVTLDGGDPAQVSLTAIQTDGTFGFWTYIAAVGSHTSESSGSPHRDQVVSACGQDVYYLAHTSEEVGHVRVHPDGAIVPSGAVSVPDVNGVYCDQERGLLFTVSHRGYTEGEPPANTFGLGVLRVQADGSLSVADSLELAVPEPPPPEQYFGLHVLKQAILKHPRTGELWVIIGVIDTELLWMGMYAYRLDTQPNGTVQILEGPTRFGDAEIAMSFAFSSDGAHLAMAGYSGGCFAWSDVVAGGIPRPPEDGGWCSALWSGTSVVTRAESDLYYLATKPSSGSTQGVVIVGSFTSPVPPNFISQHVQDSPLERVLLTHDDSVLVAFDREGFLVSYTTDASGTLTPVASTTQYNVTLREGGVIVPCDR